MVSHLLEHSQRSLCKVCSVSFTPLKNFCPVPSYPPLIISTNAHHAHTRHGRLRVAVHRALCMLTDVRRELHALSEPQLLPTLTSTPLVCTPSLPLLLCATRIFFNVYTPPPAPPRDMSRLKSRSRAQCVRTCVSVNPHWTRTSPCSLSICLQPNFILQHKHHPGTTQTTSH